RFGSLSRSIRRASPPHWICRCPYSSAPRPLSTEEWSLDRHEPLKVATEADLRSDATLLTGQARGRLLGPRDLPFGLAPEACAEGARGCFGGVAAPIGDGLDGVFLLECESWRESASSGEPSPSGLGICRHAVGQLDRAPRDCSAGAAQDLSERL